jgi:hypothetical protein
MGVAEGSLLAPEVAAVHADVTSEIRERYVAYRRAQAELRAWVEFGGEDESATESRLRTREAQALDALVKAPAGSVADLAVKLQVLKDLSSGNPPASTSAALKVVAEEASRLALPIGKLEGQIAALRIGLMLLLNAAAGDPKSLERARKAILDLIESPTGPLANSKLDETAKEEVGSLFTWID